MRIFFFIMLFAMTESNCVEEIDRIEWSVAAYLPSPHGDNTQPGLAGPVTGIVNNKLLVSGGANFLNGMPWHGGKKFYHDDIYLFDKRNAQLVAATVSKQKLPQPLAYCANVTTPDGLVYLGGENEQGILDRVVWIKSNSTINELEFADLPSLPLPLSNLSAAYINHIIYAGGGNSKEGSSCKFFCLDMLVPGAGWKELPDIPVQVAFGVMVAQSDGDHDCIYLIGGRRKNNNGISDIFNTVHQYDIKNKQWKQKHSLPYSVSAGTGIACNPNQILLFGGDRGETFGKEERLSARIRTEKDEHKNTQLVKEKIALLEAHPGFTGDILLYNTSIDRWEKIDPMPPGSPVTTTALKWGDEIIIPSGEIKAGVRTPKILMGKLKNSR